MIIDEGIYDGQEKVLGFVTGVSLTMGLDFRPTRWDRLKEYIYITYVTQKSLFKQFLPLRVGVRPEWIPSGKSPAGERQESDGVCSDFGADNTLGFLRNHQQLRWETIACVALPADAHALL